MKKTLLLTLAFGLAGASSLLASTVDVYITGSTAFRANVYNACTKLYSSAPTIYYANAANGGANSGFSAKTASWCMTGTPITGLTNIQGSTLVITWPIHRLDPRHTDDGRQHPAALGLPSRHRGRECRYLCDEQPHHRLFRCVRQRQSLSGDGQLR